MATRHSTKNYTYLGHSIKDVTFGEINVNEAMLARAAHLCQTLLIVFKVG